MAPPIATDPVIAVCLFPAVLHFSKPTKRKRERVRNRFVKGKLTKRESLRAKRDRGTMAATHAATCLLPLLPPKTSKVRPHHVIITCKLITIHNCLFV